jgi:hypothetical protein
VDVIAFSLKFDQESPKIGTNVSQNHSQAFNRLFGENFSPIFRNKDQMDM